MAIRSKTVLLLAVFLPGLSFLALQSLPLPAAAQAPAASAPLATVNIPRLLAPKPTSAQLRAYNQLILNAQRSRPPISGSGVHCYSGHYPNPTLTEVPCLPPSPIKNMVRKVAPSPTPTGQQVGNGTDYFAEITGGTTASVIGSFPTVDVKTETGSYGGTARPNTYSIQINPNTYQSTNFCLTKNGCTSASIQFVYTTTECQGMPCVEIEYWLFNQTKATCPTNWSFNPGTDGSVPGCFGNFDTSASAISWADLPTAEFSAFATSDFDTFSVIDAEGAVGLVATPSEGLSSGGWTTTEFNLVGDGDGTNAQFSNGTSTLGLNLAVDYTANANTTTPASLSCSSSASGGLSTQETNNLSLGPCSISGSNMQFSESGGTPASAPPSLCAQLSTEIATELKIISNLTNNPPSCPANEPVSICNKSLSDAEAVLADLRNTYKMNQCQPPF